MQSLIPVPAGMEPAAEPRGSPPGGPCAAVLQPDAPGLPRPGLHRGSRSRLSGSALAGGAGGLEAEQEPRLGQDRRVCGVCARHHCGLVWPLQGEVWVELLGLCF